MGLEKGKYDYFLLFSLQHYAKINENIKKTDMGRGSYRTNPSTPPAYAPVWLEYNYFIVIHVIYKYFQLKTILFL